MASMSFPALPELAQQLQTELVQKKFVLLYAYNGTGNQTLYKRVIDLMSHGDYSLYEPREMMPENKEHFGRALRQFISSHPFSPTLFSGSAEQTP